MTLSRFSVGILTGVGVSLIILFFAYSTYAQLVDLDSASLEILSDKRFATSTMDIQQIEQSIRQDSKMDEMVKEQRKTNDLLRAIYNK